MRRFVSVWLLTGLCFVLFGCGGSDEPESDTGLTVDVEDQPTEPEVVSPLELLPDEQDEPGAETPSVNAVHERAGRSAFPEQDETLTQPIAATRLSDEDQFASAIDEADIPDVVPWDEAKQYVGYEITVEGKIDHTHTSGNVNFLNFHREWRGKFYMVIFDDLAKTLPQGVEQTFKGKTLRVTGEVEDHRGRPQIKILSMDQVEFVGE